MTKTKQKMIAEQELNNLYKTISEKNGFSVFKNDDVDLNTKLNQWLNLALGKSAKHYSLQVEQINKTSFMVMAYFQDKPIFKKNGLVDLNRNIINLKKNQNQSIVIEQLIFALSAILFHIFVELHKTGNSVFPLHNYVEEYQYDFTAFETNSSKYLECYIPEDKPLKDFVCDLFLLTYLECSEAVMKLENSVFSNFSEPFCDFILFQENIVFDLNMDNGLQEHDKWLSYTMNGIENRIAGKDDFKKLTATFIVQTINSELK